MILRSLISSLYRNINSPLFSIEAFVGSFSPTMLFSAGEQGVWYDPSDMSTMFQDSAGTTPVTAVEQPVGLILDKSKGLVLGPELVDTANTAAFWQVPSGGTATQVADYVSITSTVANSMFIGVFNAAAGTTINLTVNAPYLVEFEVAAIGGINFDFLNISAPSGGSITPSLEFIKYKVVIYPSNISPAIRFRSVDPGEEVRVKNISVRELPGNHATQTTTTSRPVLSARVNLLTGTEAFATWSSVGSSTTSNTTATTDPLGGNSADILVASASSGEHYVHQSANGVVGANYTVSVYAKAREYTVLRLGSGLIGVNAYFDLAAGTVISPLDGSASIKSVGDGWYQCSLTKPAVTTSNGFASIIGPAINNSQSYTGDGTSGIYVWGADLRATNMGVGLPAYQRVNTATDYDTAGFPMYLRFDGVDDWLVTPSIDFTATDKMTVFAGVRKLGYGNFQVIAELSNASFLNNGSFGLFATGDGANSYLVGARASAKYEKQTLPLFTPPISSVITVTSDFGGTAEQQSAMRINGVSQSLLTLDGTNAGTGNYGNYPLYIGRRAGTSLQFNGNLYSLIVRGAQSTAQQVSDTETWVNQRTRAYA